MSESAKAALKAACHELGLQEDVELVEVVNRFRWVLSYTQDKTKPNFADHMIKLERLLHKVLNLPIDLRLAERIDRNKRTEKSGRA